jgi:hypothetical protein
VDALGLHALLAEKAGAVRKGERHHDHIADLEGANVAAGLLDDADRLVPQDARAVVWVERLVGPGVGTVRDDGRSPQPSSLRASGLRSSWQVDKGTSRFGGRTGRGKWE